MKTRHLSAGLLLALAVLLAIPAVAAATIHNVSYPWELNTAMGSLSPGDEVVLAPGYYDLDTYAHGYYITTSNVTIRGQSGSAGDVVLWGGGMNNSSGVYEAMQFAASDITLKDLTLEGFYHHAVHFGPAADRCVVDNVTTLNVGSQHMKGAVNNDDCIIRNCKLYQTEVRQCRPGHPVSPCNYIGGIDLHGARRVQIHDNLVMDIIGSADGGDGGIFLWNASQDCVIERNVVIGCSKGIELGNPSDQGLWQVQDTIVRNNFVLSRPNEDIGLELCYTKNCKVYNNTIYRTGAPGSADWGRTVHIWDNASHPTTNLDIRNNIIRGAVWDNSSGDWSSAAVEAMGNIVDTAGTLVLPEWFVDPDNLNLHLTEAALAAIDAAVTLADVSEDIDRGPRPYGDLPDMGADEFGSPMGDINYDGLVDGGDYTIWADHYGQSDVGFSGGDLNGDGVVNGGDYTLWADNYNFGVAGASAVPEPTALVVLLLSVGIVARRGRKAGA